MGSLGSALQRTIYGHTGTPTNPSIPPPQIAEAIPMPDPDDPLLLKQRRRSIAAQYASKGRASTILSDLTPEPLGGA